MLNKHDISRLRRLVLSGVVLATTGFSAGAASDDVLTKDASGSTVINTTSLTDFRGYAGLTPLKITISKDGIIKHIKPLANQESPRYFKRATSLLSAWEGKSVKDAANIKVDAVTGATYSSKAIIKNMEAGLSYYSKNAKAKKSKSTKKRR